MLRITLSDITSYHSVDIQLPAALQDKIILQVKSSWSESTFQTYNSAPATFFDYLDQMLIPPTLRFPTSDQVIASFLSHYAKLSSASYLRNCLSAIRAYHILCFAPYNPSLLSTQALLAATRNSQPCSKQRPPITIDLIQGLRRSLTLTDSFDRAVWAAATTAFWCQCRLGKLLSTKKDYFSTEYIPSFLNFTWSRDPSKPSLLTLPHTKTGRSNPVEVVVLAQDITVCPVLALAALQAQPIPATMPLFSYIESKGALFTLTKLTFLKWCKAAWSGNSTASCITGHSFGIVLELANRQPRHIAWYRADAPVTLGWRAQV